jgi:hypothetical protein
MLNMDVPLIALAGHHNVEFLTGLDTDKSLVASDTLLTGKGPA